MNTMDHEPAPTGKIFGNVYISDLARDGFDIITSIEISLDLPVRLDMDKKGHHALARELEAVLESHLAPYIKQGELVMISDDMDYHKSYHQDVFKYAPPKSKKDGFTVIKMGIHDPDAPDTRSLLRKIIDGIIG